MEEGRKLTEEQYEIYETSCRRIDKFLQKFKENRSLKDIHFNEGNIILEVIEQLDQRDVKLAIIKYFASCDEIFEIFTMVWENLVSLKFSNLFNFSKLAQLGLGIGNLTDFSYDFGYAFGEKGLLTLLLRDIKTKNLGDRRTGFALTIIYNCCWRVPENRIICREYVDTFQDCAQSKDPEIQADAFLTLSYIVDKSEVHKISLNEPCLKFLLLALKSALGSPDGRSPVYGYSTFELLQGLNQLTINDSNKLLVVKFGGIEVLERILVRDGSSNEEKLWAARGVWQLAFKESNKVKIRHSTAIINALNKIRGTTDHFRLKEACASALFVINDVLDIDDESKGHASTRGEHRQRSVRSEESSGHGEEGHIMISYQHASQDRMLMVKSYLEEQGYNVWMDVDKMKGDILDSMAKAVQRAEVVLVCMSHRFKESQHCRTEATYAYTLNKAIIPLMLQDGFAPEDWLGALMGMKRYYPVFSDDLMRQSLPDLIRELGDRGKREKTNMVVPSLAEVTGTSPVVVHGQRSQEKRAGDDTDGNGGITDNPVDSQELLHSSSYTKHADTCIATWNVEETMEWLRSQGVETSYDSFKKVDGTRLRQIKNLLNLAPEFCLKSLKEELSLSLWDVLSLVDALEKLEF
ncbi:uncharacterized protein LOC129278315 [Lytechinus pictus]|uniref:uncharacterized protein LOC129278315 n=1 Tax=Lytechinus pictus TaxID=7653 RepID=UPI0030B9F457